MRQIENTNNDSCFVCAGMFRKFLVSVSDSITSKAFSILQCESCGLGKTWPQPEDLSPYYPSQYYGGRHGFTAQYCVRRRMRWLNQLKKGPGKLLDIGCGEGTFLLEAKKAGWTVLGVDLNPDIARANGLIVHQHLNELAHEGLFDCITLWHSLEHMPSPQKTIAAAHALLSQNGILLIAVPNAQGWQARLFGEKWLHRDVPRHLYHFGVNSLTKLLEANGLKPFQWWHQELEYDLLGWSQSALNYMFEVPNIYFDALTGRPPKVTKFIKTLNLMSGTALTLFALPMVALATMAKAGGTLIVAARRQ